MASRKGGYQLLANNDVTTANSGDEDETDSFALGRMSPNDENDWSEPEESSKNKLNIFAESSSSSSNKKLSTDAIELRSRNGSRPLLSDENIAGSPSPSSSGSGGGGRSKNGSGNNGVVLLERRVRKDDTLQKISLQFGIAVAELKRVNGFLADTDLFARDIIKIPVQRYGYNHALIMAEFDGTESTSNMAKTDDNVAASSSSISTTIPGEGTTTIPSMHISSTNNPPIQASQLLRTVDANVQKAQRQLEYQRQQSRDVFNADNGFNDDDPGDQMLGGVSRAGYRKYRNQVWLERSVRHMAMLLLVVFIFIGLPVLVYVMYKYGQPPHHPHNASHPLNSSTVPHSPQHHH